MSHHRLQMVGVCLALVPGLLLAQGSAGIDANLEPRSLVDVPTAGMLSGGTMALDVDFYQEGGVLLGLSVGVIDRFALGISYGGSRLIGADEPEMNPRPGLHAKIRVIEESEALPAIAVGLDTQGKDGYVKSRERYAIKSPGFYAVASKNYTLLGFFSIHGGINYSLERRDDDTDPNLFFGVEKTVGPVVSFVLEYNAGVNDSDNRAIGKGRGYLNLGVRWSVGGGLTLGANLKDLAQNGGDVHVGNRTVRIEYARFF